MLAASLVASKILRTSVMRLMRSKPENGIESTPWMPCVGVGLDRVLRHGQDDDRARRGSALWICSTRLGPLTRPCRSASTRTTSGRSSWIVRRALPPSVSTSSSLTLALRVQQAADVLRDLRHVLDDEQACLVTRMPSGRRYHAARLGGLTS